MTTTKINDCKNYMSDSSSESDSESIHSCDDQQIPSIQTIVDEYMTTIEDENKKLKKEIETLTKEMDGMYTRFLETFSKYKHENKVLKKQIKEIKKKILEHPSGLEIWETIDF